MARLFLLILLFFSVNASEIYAQKGDAFLKTFDERIKVMQSALRQDPDEGFKQLKELLEEAKSNENVVAELKLLSNQCWYYLMKGNLEMLLSSSEQLEKKAIEANDIVYQAKAHVYLCQAYMDSELDEEALAEHDKIWKILEKGNDNDDNVLQTKANAYTYISNLYYRRKDYKTAINKLLSAEKEIKKLNDATIRQRTLFLNYANVAAVYVEVNLDSAEIFVRKSIALKPKGDDVGFTQFLNYSVLGDIYKKRKQFVEALEYYKEAEKIYPNAGDLGNLRALYKGFTEVYDSLGNGEQSKIYNQKLSDVQLQLSENKFNSVHKILKKSGNQEKVNYTKFYYLIGGAVLISAILLLLFLKQRKKTNHLAKSVEAIPLIDLLQNNDPGFLFAFEKTFPHFFNKLNKIAPDLTKTELEFCALIKLNLTTKEIARIKVVNPKSVQNNKYRVRKKLNIPTEVDIYDWFQNF